MIVKHLNNYIITLCLILYSININANATESFKRYEISILSIGEGSSLADAFGHTGIRVRDSVLQNDIVFNYGIYDFNAPNFYSNFPTLSAPYIPHHAPQLLQFSLVSFVGYLKFV